MPRPDPFPDLPVVEALDGVRAALDTRCRAVLVAPPGAGKTTLVPLVLADAPWAADSRIVVLEPRRLAARAAARRMADLVGRPVGDLVGYRTRDEQRVSAATRIEVVTEGILTRRLQTDPELPGTCLVIFDEVHERNLTTDLGLALLLDASASLRPDLRILAMSATADSTRLATLLGDPEHGDAPVVSSEGRTFPVDIRWLPRNRKDRIEDATALAVRTALADEPGDVLVFLPGIGEIERTRRALEPLVGSDVDLRPLAGSLSMSDQDLALAPSPPGRRRVVLSTDIAETSLTVEGVRIIVDSGLARSPRFDVRTGMTRLTTVTTSRSSAEQRAGRAGRTESGVCYRLWSKIEHGTRAAHPTPEIDEVDLSGLVLEVAAWGTPIDRLRFPSPPSDKAVRAARELLQSLGALEPDGGVTAIGRRMLDVPVHPRLARMLVAEPSALGCVIAAVLDDRDVFRGRPDDLPADLGLRIRAITGRGDDDRADRAAVRRIRQRAGDLARRLGVPFDQDLVDSDRAGAVLLHAFPDRLAHRRRPGQFQLRSGSGAWIPDTDPLAREAFVVAADLDGRRDRSRIRLAAALDADEIAAELADDVDERIRLEWDHDRDDLVELVERRLGAMQLGATTRRPSPGIDTVAALLDRVRVTKTAVLGWSGSAVQLRRRVEYLHRTLGAPWPDWTLAALVDSLDEWLAPYLERAVGRADLDRLDVELLLRSQLPWSRIADLDRLAPERLDLPTGRSVSIEYPTDAADRPSARVRVQDLFGTTTHPTVGGHPLVLHLLSPADRPIQVTSDLPGFWSGSWTAVRKDLAGRYPKHQWPDDPATAAPRRLKDR